ncbi:transposase [Clostridium sp.]|uniref:transposase n=1 Tax=Clostridium sp. TaxID=1506 RepID=UPI00359F5A6E
MYVITGEYIPTRFSREIPERRKNSTGWFYGFKLHLVISDRDEILFFYLTFGNVDDRNIEVIEQLSKELYGKLFGDKGYLPKKPSLKLDKHPYLA